MCVCVVFFCFDHITQGYPPFSADSAPGLFQKIIGAKVRYGGHPDCCAARLTSLLQYDFDDPSWDDVSKEAKDFIRKLLVVDVSVRYSVEQCQNHMYSF